MQLFEANLVFVRRSCRELYVLNGRRRRRRRTKIKWRNFGTDLSLHVKRHCLAKLTLYVHICHVCDGLYASWRVKATLRYRFKTLDRKPRPRSQSYIGSTTVGPDTPHSTYHQTSPHTRFTQTTPHTSHLTHTHLDVVRHASQLHMPHSTPHTPHATPHTPHATPHTPHPQHLTHSPQDSSFDWCGET